MFYNLFYSFTHSQYHSERDDFGLILPLSLQSLKQAEEKKKNEDTFEYNVTYQVPSHYRTVFREREKTPESIKG